MSPSGTARLLSVNVGLPRDVDWHGRVVHTGVWKQARPGRCRVGRLNLDGDGQGDLAGHGGENRAVFVYQIESYRHWEQVLGRSDFTFGQFGENFTVEGLGDDEVCIGDRYQIGSARFEVTQPRVTCYRVGIRLNEPRMPALLTASGRPGFYLRVLEEGEVEAGNAIVKIADGPERVSVASINALLYSSQHPRDQLERALRVGALSPGWRSSLAALVAAGGNAGNAGLTPAAAAHPAKPGFAPLEVSEIRPESVDVISLTLRRPDGQPLVTPLPGQFIVLRLRPDAGAPPLFRSYSLSAAASSESCESYRISVKIEPHGVAGRYLSQRVRAGDVLEVSAPRGSFVLQPGEGPVVLLSAGIGVTPVLAMLHALAATSSQRQVWWLHGARNRQSHPFALESKRLLQTLAHGSGRVFYSQPDVTDRLADDYDAAGRLTALELDRSGVPGDTDIYLCGPAAFLKDWTEALPARGTPTSRIHAETFVGGQSLTPGLVASARRAPHLPPGDPGTGALVSFARSGIAARWQTSRYQSLLEFAEACDVPVRWSCRTGVCHSCESGLVSGSVAYGPEPLDAPADGNLLICCSQPQGDVVIDL